MMASIKGYTATVQLLLEAGADKDAKSRVRETKRKHHTHLHTCG
jgi:ankyrin repeat protein